jgi:IS30 family transposase
MSQGFWRAVRLVERKSGVLRVRRVPNGEAGTVMRAVAHVMHPLKVRVHTPTGDNGSEFAQHAVIDIALDAKSFFADPYSSWQRGSNENMAIPFFGPTD